MHKTKLKAGLAGVLATTMSMAMMVTPAFAATQYTPIGGSTFTFDKYLMMDTEANVPDMTFTFSIAPGTAVAYTAGSKVEVYAGNDATKVTGTPSIAAVAAKATKDASGPANEAGAANADFNPGDTTYTAAQSGDTLTVAAGKKYASKAVGVDFSSVQFKEPGVYRYIITETDTAQQGITYDTQAATAGQKTRILDVYVIDDGNGALKVDNYVLHETADDVDAATGYGSDGVETKSTGFVNDYTTYDLTFSKAVAGNQASRDKYFKFTVALTNAPANTIYDVDITNIDAAPEKTAATIYEAATMGAANAADGKDTMDGKQIATDASGAATVDYYLQHGQSVVIKGLPQGAKYTVTEVPEDYKPSTAVTGDATNATDNDIATSNTPSVADTTTGITADTTNAFTNTRDGVVPTGIAVAAGAGIAAIGAGAVGLFLASKKRKDEE